MKFNAQRIVFTPYTSLPATLDVATCLEASPGTAIEIRGIISAGGAGYVYLVQWVPEMNGGAGKWHIYRHKGEVDSAALNGEFHHTWLLPKYSMGYYQLLVLAPLVSSPCCAELSVY